MASQAHPGWSMDDWDWDPRTLRATPKVHRFHALVDILDVSKGLYRLKWIPEERFIAATLFYFDADMHLWFRCTATA